MDKDGKEFLLQTSPERRKDKPDYFLQSLLKKKKEEECFFFTLNNFF